MNFVVCKYSGKLLEKQQLPFSIGMHAAVAKT